MRIFLISPIFLAMSGSAAVIADATPAKCSLNAGPETECIVDFSVNGPSGAVDFTIPAGKMTFKGALDGNSKLNVLVLELPGTAYPVDSGECNVSPGHVLCTAKSGAVSAVLEAKR